MSKQLSWFENEETNNFNFVYESIYSFHWEYDFWEGIEISLSAKLNYQLSNFTSIDKNLHIYNRRKEVNGSKIWQEEIYILQIQFRRLSRSQFYHQDHNWLLCIWTNGRHKICNNIWWKDKWLPGKVTMNKLTF